MAVRAGIGIPSGAGLPGARLPGHRWLRQAGQVIVWLLLVVAAALAGGLGPHFPGPPPHPVPVPNPPPAPPGS